MVCKLPNLHLHLHVLPHQPIYMQMQFSYTNTTSLSLFSFLPSMSTPQLVAIEFHHVRYQKGDFLGQFLAWVSMLHIYIGTMLFSDFIHRREIRSLLVCFGQLLAMLVSLLMKNSIKQRRPRTMCAALETCDSFGWPSQHAAWAFYLAVYFTVLSFRRKEKRKWAVGAGTWSLAFLIMYSRVYLGYHSVDQVIGGAVVGSCVGVVWFWVVNTVLSGHFPAMEESWIGRMLDLKDTCHLEKMVKFEYENIARASRKYMPWPSKCN